MWPVSWITTVCWITSSCAAPRWAWKWNFSSPTTRATSSTRSSLPQAGIILNPGGYAHYSVAILDALRLCGVPAVEVLLSEPDEHEPFRKTDIVSFGCQGHFIGEGINGYLHAAAYLAQLLRLDGSAHTHLVM